MEGIRYITVEETHAVLAVVLLGSKFALPPEHLTPGPWLPRSLSRSKFFLSLCSEE
jgi:hypothetical protein